MPEPSTRQVGEGQFAALSFGERGERERGIGIETGGGLEGRER